MDKQVEKQDDGEIGRKVGGWIDRQKYRRMDKQVEKQEDGEIGRKVG